jgi:hypothetical protein
MHKVEKHHSHHENGGSSKEGKHGGRGSFSRGRGRGIARGDIVKCYTYGKEGHTYWECLDRKREGGEAHINEAQKHVEVEETKGGRNLMLRKFLLKPEKEPEEPIQ